VCWNEIKFPANLRAVREAYESVAKGDGGAPRTGIGLSSAAARERSELSDQTPAVHDLDLGEVLRELSQKRVRFVGILATDARDVVFMAGRIHEQLPDMQLFTLGSDIRYIHPDCARAMNGMLVAHASKVRLEGSWSTSLESEMVRNVFLAGRYLLTGREMRGEVVISLIGNGALWQIGPDDPSPTSNPSQTESPAVPGPARAPGSWACVFVLSILVLVVVLALVFGPSVARWPMVRGSLEHSKAVGFMRHRGRLWSLIGPCEHVDLAAQDRLVTASLLSVSVCPPLVMLVSTFARHGATPRPVMSFGIVILAVATIGPLWWMAYRGLRDADATIRLAQARFVTGAATGAAVLALGLACGPQRDATFNLMSGGSPVLPVLIGLAIFVLALWCWRVRLRFLDTHRFGLCHEAASGGLFEHTMPPIAQALGEDL
jgi:hypothetical protein